MRVEQRACRRCVGKEGRANDVMRVEEKVELEMLAVVRWMFGVMLGFDTQAGVIGGQPGRADMEEICIHALLRFVAAHVHLVTRPACPKGMGTRW